MVWPPIFFWSLPVIGNNSLLHYYTQILFIPVFCWIIWSLLIDSDNIRSIKYLLFQCALVYVLCVVVHYASNLAKYLIANLFLFLFPFFFHSRFFPKFKELIFILNTFQYSCSLQLPFRPNSTLLYQWVSVLSRLFQ